MFPTLVADTHCHTGENPLWHPQEHCLYWTDIPNGKLFRYDPATGRYEQCYNGVAVGGFTIQADGALLLFMQRGAIARWRDGKLEYLIDEIPDEQESRFNDVIADPLGRVFCGTMPTPSRLGRLYRLDRDGSLHLILEGIGISNGMGFTPDHRGLYYTNSQAHNIYLFDYDVETGTIQRSATAPYEQPVDPSILDEAPLRHTDTPSAADIWLHIPEGEGEPDGLTVDSQGYVWSARWDGSAIYRYTPQGEEVLRVEFPARKVSSLTFGGDDLSDIYVTTALAGGERGSEGAGAGALFCLQAGVRGVAEFASQILI